MSNQYIGTCTECGEENVLLTVIDEVTHLCEDCRDTDYFECDCCHEYWHFDFVNRYRTSDGLVICEHCSEDFDDAELIE